MRLIDIKQIVHRGSLTELPRQKKDNTNEENNIG